MQRLIAAWFLVCLCVLGCGRGRSVEGQVAESLAACEAAEKAMSEKNYAAARDEWTRAIDAGVLSPDQYVQACIRRALCHAQLREFEAAHRDLDTLAEGAPNTAEIQAARARVFAMQGRTAEANVEMGKARRLNPHVKAFGL